jgi:hypothetical protein
MSVNAKLVMMILVGTFNLMMGLTIAVVGVLILSSWPILLLGVFLVGIGTWIAVDSTINRARLSQQ